MGRARPFVVRTVAAVLAVILAIGCSSELPTYPAHGKIVYKGSEEPCNQGWISFECTQPPYSRFLAHINETGEFVMGTTVGEHRVCLEPGDAGATAAGMAAYLKNVDKKYLVYATSGWKVSVVPNQENNFTLHVTKPGVK